MSSASQDSDFTLDDHGAARGCLHPSCSANGELFAHKSLRFNKSDVSMTPPEVARRVVNHFKPSGRVLDPCRGDGAFWNAMPGAEWCEIREGRDFMEWTSPVDWIVTNPPFSTFMGFIKHAFDVSENVVFVIPAAKVWGSMPYHEMIEAYGGIREIVILGRGRSIGLPLGFAVGAFHFQRGYKGETRIVHSGLPNAEPTDQRESR